MPRTAATLTQADVARVIRAARQAGAREVEVRPDGTMLVRMDETRRTSETHDADDDETPIVL